MKNKICFLHQPCLHVVHKKFAKSINANFVEMEYGSQNLIKMYLNGELKNRFKEYEVILCEGGKPLKEAFFIKKVLPKIKIVELAASSLFISSYKRNLKKKIFVNFFSKTIDGVLAVSELVKSGVENYTDVPCKITWPFIEENTFKQLSKLNPDIFSNKIITIGAYSKYKNQDLALNSFLKAKKKIPNLDICFIGKYYPKKWNHITDVKCPGYVDEIKKYITASSLYLHSANADACPVSVLESSAAGLPSLVTFGTGSKKILDGFDEMVVGFSAGELASGIVKYMKKTDREKEEISNEVRKRSSFFREKNRLKYFKINFKKLLKELGV